MKTVAALVLTACAAMAQMRVVALPGKSPLVTFRMVFTAGSEVDPADKPGVAYLTANLLADGGTREMTYRQITEALFPMAASINVQVDNEMVTFSGATHVDNLNEYYKLFSAILLDPGWREDDFQRVREDAINAIKVGLRGSNDEELAKEVLYQNIYAGTPYGHYSVGTISSLEKITLDDLKQFYRMHYSQSNLIVGLAGGYPPSFIETVKKDFRKLPEGGGFRPRQKYPALIEHNRAVIVEKDTRSVALSLGFPIGVTRRDPDYPALLLAASYLGQHRMSSGVLYDEMREKRGLNYGDYAYIEYFPRGMFLMEPPPNLGRHFQLFQLWIRPVEPPNANFALRMALYDLNKLIHEGIPEDGFERTRDFLSKYVNLLTRTKRAELGYAMDAIFYTMPNYNVWVKTALDKMTRDDVNRVVKRYLRTDHLVIVAVGNDAGALKTQLEAEDAQPPQYISPKPEAVLEEDKVACKFPLHLRAQDIAVEAVNKVFE